MSDENLPDSALLLLRSVVDDLDVSPVAQSPRSSPRKRRLSSPNGSSHAGAESAQVLKQARREQTSLASENEQLRRRIFVLTKAVKTLCRVTVNSLRQPEREKEQHLFAQFLKALHESGDSLPNMRCVQSEPHEGATKESESTDQTTNFHKSTKPVLSEATNQTRA